MKFRISIPQIGLIVVAAIGSVLIAHYEESLPYRWQTYIAPDGTFSIDLPGKPTVKTNEARLESGGAVSLHSVNVSSVGNSAYTCSYVENENVGKNTGRSARISTRRQSS